MRESLTGLVDPRAVGLMRIIVGSAALLRWFSARDLIARFDDPAIVRMPVLDWLPDPASAATAVAVWLWLPAAVLFIAGKWTTPAGLSLAGSIGVYFLVDFQTYSNHLYLMVLFVLFLVIAGAGNGLGLDASNAPIPLWAVLMIQMHVSVVYLFAALTKLNEPFLSGRVLAGTLHGGVFDFPQSLKTPAVLSVVAIAAVTSEVFIAVFLWRSAFRPAAFVVGLGLHGFIVAFIGPTIDLTVFSLLMLAAYPLFLDRRPLQVVWDDDCGSCRDWIARFERFDLLGLIEPIGKSDPSHELDPRDVSHAMHAISTTETTRAFAASTRVLARLVPSLWFAPLLRLPIVRHLGEAWYRRQAARRTCTIA